mgnify:CR=1 FL=1
MNDMENQNGLNISIRGNAIHFETPDGKKFYKNWTNMATALAKGQKTFFAPESATKAVTPLLEATPEVV